ncbi:MAG: hypothetical protein KGO51_03565 [Alphaproteobacteria bacterium]|nr:hypothetical protein [Alphaproteobacteria bacterium]
MGSWASTPSDPPGHLPLKGGFLIGLLALGACSPKAAAPAAGPVQLDCAVPFETLKAKIVAQPHLVPAPKDPAEPYRFYSTDDQSTSYLITEPGAPGHPAIMIQRALPGGVKTTGCAYGDKQGYAQLLAYLDSLKTWTRK